MSGRKKISGQGALSVLGDGWSKPLLGPWTPDGVKPKDGPDIVLAAGTELPPRFADVTIASSRKDEQDV